MKTTNILDRMSWTGRAAAGALLLPALLGAQARPAADATGVRHLEQRVELRDGVHLATDVYLPPGEGPFPTLYTPTPYNTRQDPDASLERSVAARGYAYVHQNVRGRFGSEGEFGPFLDEIPDLLDSADWIVAQPWCNGAIGLVGNSSQSYSNQLLASTGHRALRAMVNISGLTDTRQLFFPGGAFRLDTLYPWLQFFYLGKPIRSLSEWQRRFRHRPLAATFEWRQGLLEEMAGNAVHTEKIGIPTLHVTGWNDVVYRQTLALRRGIGDRAEQRLIIGPWMHNQIGSTTAAAGDEDYAPDGVLDQPALVDLIVEWMDRHLRGVETPARAAARVFVFGQGFREFDQWPPAKTQARTLFLDGEAAPDRVGRLATATPAQAGSGRFVFDPDDPFPTFGGVNSHIFPQNAGPRDQARFADRTDALRFATAPAEAAYTLAGPIRVILHASSTAPDTDFTAKLCVVRPDGYVRIVEDGIVRARFRNGHAQPEPIEPGAVVRYEIDLGQTALRVEPGQRLRLDLSSSNFPKYDLNPNTGEDAFTAAEAVPATQTVHWSKEHPSALIVTVLAE